MSFEFTDCRKRFSCATDLSHAVSPIFGSQLITTKPKDYHSLIGYQHVDSYLELLWGKHSFLAGVMMPKKAHVFTIPREGGAAFYNGYDVDSSKDSLAIMLSPAGQKCDFSFGQGFAQLSVLIDSVQFDYLYETLTHQPIDEFLGKVIVRFKSAQDKEALLALITPFTKNDPLSLQGIKPSADDGARIVETLIHGLELEGAPLKKSLCRTIALKAHEGIIVSPDCKIGLAEMCKDLGVASRSLQQGFKELYGVGFIEYHRLYRYHRFRQHVKKKGIGEGEVTSLMGMFGFEHAGRFSVEYKKIFGISPSKEKKREEDAQLLIPDL